MVDNCNCDFCQINKSNGKRYGFLPERKVQSILFEEFTRDQIGPWKVQVRGKLHKYEAFDVPVQDPKSKSQVEIPSQDSKPKTKVIIVVCMFICLLLSQIPGWRMTPRSVTSEMCALQPTILNLMQLQKNTPNNWKYPKDKHMGTYTKYMGTDC